MALFSQLLADGIVTGATYALIAIGLTLIFGMMRVVNFAHGEFYMLGGYLTTSAVRYLGVNYFLALPAAVIGVAVIGLIFERVMLRRIRRADILSGALITIGLSIFLQNAALVIWGPTPDQVQDPFAGRVLDVGGISITEIRGFTLLIAIATMAALALVIKYTKMGRTMRATFQNPDAASLQGIEVDHVYGASFAVGAGLAAVAGALLSAVFVISPDMGNLANLKSFAVVILGGLGNIPGAIVGGFLLGAAESLGAGYVSTEYKDGLSFLILVLVLLARPYGLFGRRDVRL